MRAVFTFLQDRLAKLVDILRTKDVEDSEFTEEKVSELYSRVKQLEGIGPALLTYRINHMPQLKKEGAGYSKASLEAVGEFLEDLIRQYAESFIQPEIVQVDDPDGAEDTQDSQENADDVSEDEDDENEDEDEKQEEEEEEEEYISNHSSKRARRS